MARVQVFIQEHQMHPTAQISASTDKELQLEHFRDAYPQDIPTFEFNISQEDRGCIIDLSPYMNPSPFTVTMNASLPRMFRLFRGLGLRHLIVINDKNEVVGMVTRKDLAKYRLNAKGARIKVQELQIRHE